MLSLSNLLKQPPGILHSGGTCLSPSFQCIIVVLFDLGNCITLRYLDGFLDSFESGHCAVTS